LSEKRPSLTPELSAIFIEHQDDPEKGLVSRLVAPVVRTIRSLVGFFFNLLIPQPNGGATRELIDEPVGQSRC
jgi:hypothetical protein